MLYHTARISLNRPLISLRSNDNGQSSKLVSDAIELCDASVDTVVRILRRFGAQHTLKNAPFGFVHGAVVAIDVTLATMTSTSASKGVVKDTALPTLDAALAELSHAWKIARDARDGLQELLARRETERTGHNDDAQRAISASGTWPAAGPPLQAPPALGLDLEILGTGSFDDSFDVDISTMFPQCGEDVIPHAFWTSLTAGGHPSWEGEGECEDGTPSSSTWTTTPSTTTGTGISNVSVGSDSSHDSISYLYGT